MYTKEDFLKDVATEADNIKANATKTEIRRLNFNALRPTSKDGCIYGQMTGDCFSPRAADLIELCCPRYFTNQAMTIGCKYSGDAPVQDILNCVNGTIVPDFYDKRTSRCDSKHFSAIEAYIVSEGANNENLIQYIQGKNSILEL